MYFLLDSLSFFFFFLFSSQGLLAFRTSKPFNPNNHIQCRYHVLYADNQKGSLLKFITEKSNGAFRIIIFVTCKCNLVYHFILYFVSCLLYLICQGYFGSVFQSYLKDILKEIGVQNVKGIHKNTRELKPEYRHYQVEEKSD